MNDFTIHIKRILVQITNAVDRVTIYTDLPSPYPASVSEDDLEIDFQTKKGAGIEYVREHFHIEPEVIDASSRRQ